MFFFYTNLPKSTVTVKDCKKFGAIESASNLLKYWQSVSKLVTDLSASKLTKSLNFCLSSKLFLSTKTTEADQGELLYLITPLSNIFFACAFNSSLSE